MSGQEDILIALFQRTFNNLPGSGELEFNVGYAWKVLWRQENEKIDIEGAIEQLMMSFYRLIKEKNEEYVYKLPDKIKIFADRKLLMEFGVSRNSNLSSGVI